MNVWELNDNNFKGKMMIVTAKNRLNKGEVFRF
jgi:hypothetical protein